MRGMKKLLLIVFSLLVLCACAGKQAADTRQPPPDFILEHNQTAYIAIPKDIPEFDYRGPGPGHIRDDKRFPGTGRHTASMLRDAIAPYSSRVVVGKEHETEEAALAHAKALNLRYVFLTDFDIFMRRSIMTQPRRFWFMLAIKVIDTHLEKSFTNGAYISQRGPPAVTEENVEQYLKAPIQGHAKYVYEGVRQPTLAQPVYLEITR